MIDTHSHLYSRKFQSDLPEATQRAQEVLSHVFLPNIDLDSVAAMKDLTATAPDFFYPMMGLHPCSVKEDWQEVLTKMEAEFAKGGYCGVGETGLDYHWDTTFVEQQKAALRLQIEWAKDLDLPLILHCRKSMDDVIGLVREGQDGRLKGIFHCFTGTVEQANEVRDLGFLMGIGGVVTYKNGGLAEILPEIDLKDLVLETDSPYLPPVPHRGKRNESSYVPLIAQKLAEIKDVSLEEVDQVTSENALGLFGV
jgi:TatD DNase family protein